MVHYFRAVYLKPPPTSNILRTTNDKTIDKEKLLKGLAAKPRDKGYKNTFNKTK